MIREAVYKPITGDLLGHQISTFIFVTVLLSVMWFYFRKTKLDYSNRDLILIGAGWTIATIIFEFVFGHYVFGNSWEKLFTDYNVLKGRIWILVLLTSLIGPLLVGKKK